MEETVTHKTSGHFFPLGKEKIALVLLRHKTWHSRVLYYGEVVLELSYRSKLLGGRDKHTLLCHTLRV